MGTITGGKFYLRPSAWWADALPATNDGYYYWYVGQMTSKYQFALHPLHPVYYVDSSGNAKVYCVHGITGQGSGEVIETHTYTNPSITVSGSGATNWNITLTDEEAAGYVGAVCSRAWPLNTWSGADATVCSFEKSGNTLIVALRSTTAQPYAVDVQVLYKKKAGSSYGIPPLFEHYKLDVYAGEDGSFTIINNNCGGFIVTVPFLAKAVRFTKSAGYGQWGACNKDAVLPTVISTGANRVSYTGSYDAGRFELLTNSIESHYFFGGSVGTKYSDFEVELWNGVVLGMPA